MKKIFFILFAFALMLAVMPPGDAHGSPLPEPSEFVVDNPQLAPAALAQETGGVVVEQGDPGLNVDPVPATTKDFLMENWVYLLAGLIGFIDVIVRLTPTEKDNSILSWLTTLLSAFIPNYKKGGGTFVAPKKG